LIVHRSTANAAIAINSTAKVDKNQNANATLVEDSILLNTVKAFDFSACIRAKAQAVIRATRRVRSFLGSLIFNFHVFPYASAVWAASRRTANAMVCGSLFTARRGVQGIRSGSVRVL
jgi:hypothetical protein